MRLVSNEQVIVVSNRYFGRGFAWRAVRRERTLSAAGALTCRVAVAVGRLGGVWLTLLAGFIAPVFAAPAAAPALPTLSAEQVHALLPALRQGGFIFYFRHAATRHDQVDRQPVVLNECATQRNLSAAGQAQASAIGEAFRALRIPVGRVLSSPFCRCVETASRAFSVVETRDDLYFAIGLKQAERQAKGEALSGMLAQPPAAGSNTVLVAHTANLKEAAHIWPKPEGVAIVFRPDGHGGFEVFGRIAPDTWPRVSAMHEAR